LIESIACGAAHTVVLAKIGDNFTLFAFGLNDQGQLGLSEQELDKIKRQKLIKQFCKSDKS
jgi:alpha-tubulin suppressor-like RCC1 family protein